MIVVELSFDNHPRRLAARPAHRRRLQALRDRRLLVMAGPWADETGALLLFDADDKTVVDILAADPYYSMPGVTITRRQPWNPLPLD